MSALYKDWLTTLLSRHDPEGLIEGGAPWDEYTPEAEVALPLLLKASNEKACLDVLEETWDRMFGNEHVDREFLEPAAREIWKDICTCRAEKRKAASR